MTTTLTILGCSGSMGVPAVGYGWGACDPHEPKNNRTRPSILLQKDGFNLIIDAGPDVRVQLTRIGNPVIHAVLFTHGHFDHIGGVGDLLGAARVLGHSLPFYAHGPCAQEIHERNRYVFERIKIGPVHAPQPIFTLHTVPMEGPLQIGPFQFQTFPLDHYDTITLGLRLGRFAYLIDFRQLDERLYGFLQNLDTLICDANNQTANSKASPGHIDLAGALACIARIKPRQAYLSHLPSWHDYQTLLKNLPTGVEPAYDGLSFPIAGA